MSVVKLTRKNFTNYLKEHVDDSFDSLFASAMLGGKNKVKDILSDVPEEQEIYIDTKYVMAVNGPIRLKETQEVIFQITLASPVEGQTVLNIKGEEFEDFIHIWAGEREYLGPGTYKVGCGQDCKEPWAKLTGPKMYAEISEDGLTVTVKEVKEVTPV